jgi:hypothetical protein
VSDENAEAQKKALRKRVALRADYRAAFGTESGRRVLRDLFKVCVLDNVGYMQKETALHSQGRRFVFVRIHKMLNMDDKEIQRLIGEYDG